MKTAAISCIEEALQAFPPEEQEQLGQDFVSYLKRLKALEEALAVGMRDYAEGRFVTLEELEQSLDELRRQYAGD
jgi:predicted transcriptional regulator